MPSKSGKTVALISLILEQCRGVECQHRRRLDPRQEVHRGGPGGEHRAGADVLGRVGRGVIQQRKITEASKKLEMKKLYQVLVVIDDFADTPQLQKPRTLSSSGAGACRSAPG